ncbi:MAG: diaminobutyrate--2-oxoglutarate transaminase [Desulfobacterales bacterium]|nr:diaminobutyrate--2-oxoglutarate transaminase [Desulfobacterales bacterium]
MLIGKGGIMEIFQNLESEVRNYCRSFPCIFEKGQGYYLFDENGRTFIDFFSGAGALNYGHNHPQLKEKLIEYIQTDGIVQSLDMATKAKQNFIERFNEVILVPRDLKYKFQFTGPTGTNSVEAALKLVRKETGRQTVVFFFNAFHGMTLGALSLTFNPFKRAGAGVPLNNSVAMPFAGSLGDDQDTIEYMELYLKSASERSDLPAAVILETIQGEGGVNLASFEWLKRLEELLHKYEVLMIVDDIQAGCGRTGPFFSFEPAGIKPDIICLSKSLSGYGLPFSVVLLKPELDVWAPGEHCGTFRGHNLAFVTSAESLTYWETDEFSKSIMEKSEIVSRRLDELSKKYPKAIKEVRGRGLMWGIECAIDGLAGRLSKEAFERGLVIEKTGREDQVLKLMPALTIDESGLTEGLNIIEECFDVVLR